MNSWIAVNEDSVETRMTKILLSGFSVDLHIMMANGGITESSLLSNVDVDVEIEMTASASKVRCHLSDVLVRLSYKEYEGVRCIVQENIGKKTDRNRWENLEKAWEKESEHMETDQQDLLTYSVDVAYSSSARLVRYGLAKTSRSVAASMKLSLSCASLGLVLRRDDTSEISYDMIGIRGQGFDCDLGRKEDGEEWLNLSLRSIFVVDLGKAGRQLRSQYDDRKKYRTTDSLSVLAEGYLAQQANADKESEVQSHLVVKIDRESVSTGDINIIIIISFLSVTAFVEPLQELMSFVTGKWSDTTPSEGLLSQALPFDVSVNEDTSSKHSEPWYSSIKSEIKVRLVSHYARLIFAAEESDPHSRSLMLRG
jgi:hypothetical protein